MALTLHPRKHAPRRADVEAVRRNASNSKHVRGRIADPALTAIGTAAATIPQSLHWAHRSEGSRRT